MKKLKLPMTRKDWKKTGVKKGGKSLMTPLALVEGEILKLVEEKGRIALQNIMKVGGWPAPIILMAVGALVREKLITAKRSGTKIILEAV